MRRNIVDLQPRECRYPVTEVSPHMFCAAATAEGQSYCPEHRALCTTGPGKDWQSLAEMIRITEQTIVRVKPPEDLALPLDEIVRAVPV